MRLLLRDANTAADVCANVRTIAGASTASHRAARQPHSFTDTHADSPRDSHTLRRYVLRVFEHNL